MKHNTDQLEDELDLAVIHAVFILSFFFFSQGKCEQSARPGRCRVHLPEPSPHSGHHGHDEEV